MLTSGAHGGASSFPTSLARYLVPTTSGMEIEGGVGTGCADYLAIAPELQPGRGGHVQWKRVGKRETG